MPNISTLAQPAIVLATSAAGLAGAGLIAAIPRLFSLLVPKSPISGFVGASALLPGTNVRRVFGLTGTPEFFDPGLAPAQAVPFRAGFINPLIGRAGNEFADRQNTLGPAASAALSFDPAVAALGEQRIVAIMNRPNILGIEFAPTADRVPRGNFQP